MKATIGICDQVVRRAFLVLAAGVSVACVSPATTNAASDEYVLYWAREARSAVIIDLRERGIVTNDTKCFSSTVIERPQSWIVEISMLCPGELSTSRGYRYELKKETLKILERTQDM